MANQKDNRKLILTAAGGALLCFILAPAGTFTPSSYFGKAEKSKQDTSIVAVSITKDDNIQYLDPVIEATSRKAGTRAENQKIADLYGIDLYPKKVAAKTIHDFIPDQEKHSGIDILTVSATADSHPANPPIVTPIAQAALVEDHRTDANDEALNDLLAGSSEDHVFLYPLPRPAGLSKEELKDPIVSASIEDATDWIQVIAPGDSLDVVLKRADIFANERYAITSAVAEKFDLGHLRPGNKVRVIKNQAGDVSEVDIWVSKDKVIEAKFGQGTSVRIVNSENLRSWPQ